MELPDGYRRGADHENNKGAAFCCAMGRASGRGAPRAGDSSSQCSKGMGGGNRAATCRAASPATKCTAQTPPRALEGRGSARSRPRVAHRHRPVVLVASPGASLRTARRALRTGLALERLAQLAHVVISGFPWGVNRRHHPRNGGRQQRVRASRSWCAYSRPSLPLWMLGWAAKMLGCPVLKQFAASSSRRSQ